MTEKPTRFFGGCIGGLPVLHEVGISIPDLRFFYAAHFVGFRNGHSRSHLLNGWFTFEQATIPNPALLSMPKIETL